MCTAHSRSETPAGRVEEHRGAGVTRQVPERHARFRRDRQRAPPVPLVHQLLKAQRVSLSSCLLHIKMCASKWCIFRSRILTYIPGC